MTRVSLAPARVSTPLPPTQRPSQKVRLISARSSRRVPQLTRSRYDRMQLYKWRMRLGLFLGDLWLQFGLGHSSERHSVRRVRDGILQHGIR